MGFLSFIAGFFREGAPESSARLVGIASCVASIIYAFTHKADTFVLAQTAAMFTNGLIALGLRKRSDGEAPPAAPPAPEPAGG